MDKNLLDSIADKLGGQLNAAALKRELFRGLVHGENYVDAVEEALLDPHLEISERMDDIALQQSCSVRNVLRARQLATALIDDDGRIETTALSRSLDLLRDKLHWLGPNREHDAPRQEHIQRVLLALADDKSVQQALQRISSPAHSPIAEKLIRETLALAESEQVTNAHARRAALSAALCYLRQNVGSCFATAPAIIVQKEQLDVFFSDLAELFATERLQRVADGKEYIAPLTTSWGIGDLRVPVVVAASERESPVAYWLSPGVQAALSTVGVIDGLESLKTLYFEAIQHSGVHQGRRWMTVESLLGLILRHHNKVTEAEVQDFEKSLEAPLRMDLVQVAVKSAAGPETLRRRCERYHVQLAQSCHTFKAWTDNPLLKAWEFTLASFAETKANFSRWNLYTSLGFDVKEPDGIAASLYETVKERLDSVNQEIQEQTQHLEQIQLQVEYSGQRMRRASSERELKFMQTEYQARVGEFRHEQTKRDLTSQKAQQIASLHKTVLDQLDDRFPLYFQEVYDPDMHEVSTGPYDDAPAGFRLLCKHGRHHASQWTLIYTAQEFVDSLAAFLVSVEHELLHLDEFEAVRDEIATLITKLVAHVKSSAFLESALHRMARAHGGPVLKEPLKHLDKLPKKPWSYTSGGTMSGLVASYFGRDSEPKASERWVENPTELLCFLIDTMRAMPTDLQREFTEGNRQHVLMHSPTHGFNLIPNQQPFRDAWLNNDHYSYTWVRDNWITGTQRYYSRMTLEKPAMDHFLRKLEEELPEGLKAAYWQALGVVPVRSTVADFRDYILRRCEQEPRLHWQKQSLINAPQVDALLYSQLPYTPSTQLRSNLNTLFSKSFPSDNKFVDGLLESFDLWNSKLLSPTMLSRQELRDVAIAVLLTHKQAVRFPNNMQRELQAAASRCGLAPPPPIVFADSNWVSDYFAFLVNPATQALELWRCSHSTSQATPMEDWNIYLDGSQREQKWGVYTNPHQYTATTQFDRR